MNDGRNQVFLVNTKTSERVPLISLHKLHKFDRIYDIKQTSKLAEESKANDFNDLQEIMLHFKLALWSKDGGDATLTYCQLKLSREVIKFIAETKGHIPSYLTAVKELTLLADAKGYTPSNLTALKELN